MAVDAQTFREVMAHFATGVAVVTTLRPEGFHGLTVNAFCSVSLEPPLVLVCLDRLSLSHDYVRESGVYGVSILGRGQMFLADRFSGQAPLVSPRFEGVPYRTAATGVPLLGQALAWLDCRVAAEYDGGDHTIFLGQVEAAGVGAADAPLVFYGRRYVRLG
ncbi:MAG: flavin reductase [Chloroflexi bacterium]|nr:flavin reductase [Chloroflexota bacterium]